MNLPDFFKKHGFSAAVDQEALLAAFFEQMDSGLAGKPSSLAMLPSWVDISSEVPTKTPIIVLDAGGTNLRVAVVWFDETGKARIEDFQKYRMPGTDGVRISGREFFDSFADFLRPVSERAESVGFCFSYPARITPDMDGELLRWSKNVDAPEVVGTRVGAEISAALERATGRKLRLLMLNDTTATLLAGKTAGISRKYSSYVGFILGTGTNTAYVESNSRIGKAQPLDPDGFMIVNVESGAFGGAPRSEFDVVMDEASTDPGVGVFEKMISGAYMGPVGLVALKAAASDGLFSAAAADALLSLSALSTMDFDNFTANPFRSDGALGAIPFTDDDRRTVMAIGEPFFVRAASFTAVNIAAAVLRSGGGRDPLHPVCVTIDGSTYWKTRSAMFRSRVEQGLREILAPRGIHFETLAVDDAPMVGSAVAGLIAR